MPPPPRRRRPVQPATRVRLPRTPRPHGEPAGEEAPELTPEGQSSAGTGQPAGLAGAPAQPDQTAEAGPGTAASREPEPVGLLTDEAPAAGAGDTELAGSTGAAEQDQDREAEDRADKKAGPDRDRTAGEAGGEHVREPLLLPVCLGVVAVALGGLAVWFGLKSGGTPTAATGFGPGTGNAAVVDQAATAQVNQQIDKAVDTIFSYDYADTAHTADAAKDLLTGPASAQYATLFKVVQQQAPKEKLVLTTTVTNSGVEMLNGDTARLLIFANQKDTGAAKASTTEAGAMFAVTAVKQGGQWKIDSIDTFAAPG
jgi:Mce-associated membrane protein